MNFKFWKKGGGEGEGGEPGGSSMQNIKPVEDASTTPDNAPWMKGATQQNTVGLTGEDFKESQPLTQPKLQTDVYSDLEKSGQSMGETNQFNPPAQGQSSSSEKPAA